MNTTAQIIFTLAGRRYVYDGGLPPALERAALTYPESLVMQEKEPGDTLPTALYEIAQLGGQVIEIIGARPSGAILEGDWAHPRIY